MKVPRWMLAPLYGYALIQMIYVFFFKLPPAWQVYTYLVALLFKVCLFLVVTHLLHAGNLRRYLEAPEDGKLGPQTEGGEPEAASNTGPENKLERTLRFSRAYQVRARRDPP